ncbi:MAG: ATP-binding protein [Erysipelotrichaceae bacterium]|nr:ATP-binding protein [Erysipelotrichaceae bacterium]
MMEDIAMHILEILMNSIKAGASLIILRITDSLDQDVIKIEIIDDGKGMSEEMAAKAADPFTTSRTTRKIGLGLSFMKGLAETCNGTFKIDSQLGVGTTVTATVQKLNIDTPELGDIGEILMESIQSNGDIDYEFDYITDVNAFHFDTKMIRETLDGVSLLLPEILLWIKDYINQGIEQAKEEDTQ